jgi:DNA-binding MarR family transcriptional regulator
LLADAVGDQLAKLIVRARATTTQAAARFHPDLPPAAFHVARWLSSYGPGRTSDIADGVAMDRSAVSRLLVALRATGMVRVQTDPSDGRASLVSLTAAGRRHLAEATEWKGARFHDRLAHWSEHDLSELARLLAMLNRTEA